VNNASQMNASLHSRKVAVCYRTVSQVAEETGYSCEQIRRLIKTGYFSGCTCATQGGHYRLRENDDLVKTIGILKDVHKAGGWRSKSLWYATGLITLQHRDFSQSLSVMNRMNRPDAKKKYEIAAVFQNCAEKDFLEHVVSMFEAWRLRALKEYGPPYKIPEEEKRRMRERLKRIVDFYNYALRA
jgi:hypothetical protein